MGKKFKKDKRLKSMEHMTGLENENIKNITDIMREAVKNSEGYRFEKIAKELEQIPNIWCTDDYDSNGKWYIISRSDGKTVIEDYGYLSSEYPIAFLFDTCPKEVREKLLDNQVLIDDYSEKCCCDEEVLGKYINKRFLDDRFMYDYNLPFNEEVFIEIDDGACYINPYNFCFTDLLEDSYTL